MNHGAHRLSNISTMPQADLQPGAILAETEASAATTSEYTTRGLTIRRILGVGAVASALVSGIGAVDYVHETHQRVPNHVVSLPPSDVPNILGADTAPSSVLNSPSAIPHTTHPAESIPAVIPEIAPSAPTRLLIPRLHIDTDILPVTSTPTGQKNSWGGEIYNEINFPVDSGKQMARYWTQAGEPNTLTNVSLEQNAKAVERVVIYGHASDNGHNLLFQNLQQLKLGDSFSMMAGDYEYTYTVYSLSNPAKDGLLDDSQVYGLPVHGRKEAALVACLPDSASHSVRIGYLSSVKRIAPASGLSN